MTTLRDLYEWIRTADVDSVGIHELEGSKWSLQIYSNKRQVNVCYDGLSHMNITFPDDETARVYRCPRPGYCDYSHSKELSLDLPISMLHNGAVQETLRDCMKGFKARPQMCHVC